MPTQDDIVEQQQLLDAHRRTLAAYLKQQALVGGAQATPVAVTHGIAEARASIARVKRILRGWNVAVEDHPDDVATDEQPLIVQATYAAMNRRWQGQRLLSMQEWDIVRWWTLATIAGSALGYGVSRGPGLALAQRLIEAEVSWPAGYMLGFAVMGALVGAGCGVGQWLVLRRHGWHAPGWAGVCVIAYGLGWGIANSVGGQVKPATGNFLGDIVGWGSAGIVIGLTQWLAQLQHIRRAGWWILANAGGWALGWALGTSVSLATGLNGRPVGHVVIGMLGGMVGGAVVGVATGNIMVRMVGPLPLSAPVDEGAPG